MDTTLPDFDGRINTVSCNNTAGRQNASNLAFCVPRWTRPLHPDAATFEATLKKTKATA